MTTCPVCQQPFDPSASRRQRVLTSPTCSFGCREELQRRLTEEAMSRSLDEPLKQFLRRRYAEGATLKQLGIEIGRDATQLLRIWFPRYGIETRPPNRGNTPNGMTDKNSKAFQRNRARMRTANPSGDEATACRMSVARAAAYRRKPSPHEAAVCTALETAGIQFAFQHPIDRYIADFFFPGTTLTIEVGTWRAPARVKRQRERDAKVATLGFEVVRIAYRKRPELTAKAVLAFLKERNLIPVS